MDSNLWKRLYTEQSEFYERLVQHEDYEGNLLRAINELYPLAGARVIEFGGGTGRLTAQLAPLVDWVGAFDITPGMVKVAAKKRSQTGKTNWLVGLGDSRTMPVMRGCADLAIEGWSVVQIGAWHLEQWQKEVSRAVDEMLRVVRPGGMVIMIETLGTGAVTPNPPQWHRRVHAYLEQERGFASNWLRTDFQFVSRVEAHELEAPLFGEKVLASLIETGDGVILPECTGIWWREV